MKKYLMIYEKIKKDIIDGAIKSGDKLPSKRAIALSMQVSVISVEHAYELLVSEGYCKSRERSGYFACYKRGNFFVGNEKPERPTANVCENGHNEGISFDKLAKTTRYVLSCYGEQLLVKSPNSGTDILKNAIKDYLQRNKGIIVEPAQIIIGSGAEYLYGLIAELFDKNTLFGIESPSYHQIENVYKSRDVRFIPLKTDNNGIPYNTLKNCKAKVLHITPFKSFPSLVYADASKKAEYLEWAEKNDAYLIEDDYQSEFSLSGNISQTVFAMDNNDRVIYINTFTKTICRSIRLGYMIIPKPLLCSFNKKLGFYSCPVPTLEQYVVATILNDGTFEKHLNKVRRIRKNMLNGQ